MKKLQIIKISLLITIISFVFSDNSLFSQSEPSILLDSSASGWEVKNAYWEQKLKIPSISLLKMSSDGVHFFTYSTTDNVFRKWNSETGELIHSKQINLKPDNVDVSHNGEYISIGISNMVYIFKLFDAIDTLVVQPFKNKSYNDCPYGIKVNAYSRFVSDSEIVVGGNLDCCFGYGDQYSGTLSAWNYRTLKENKTIFNGGEIQQIRQSDDMKYLVINAYGHYYASIGFGNSNVSENHAVFTLDDLFNSVKTYYSASGSGTNSEYETYTSIKRMQNVYISNDAKYIAGLFSPSDLNIYDLKTASLLKKIRLSYSNYGYSLRDIAFTNNNQYIITSSTDAYSVNSIKFWDIKSGVLIDSIMMSVGKIIIPDNSQCFITASGGTIYLFKPKILSSELNVDFLADSTTIAVGDSLGFHDFSTGTITMRLWDFGNGKKSSKKDTYTTYDEPGFYTVSLITGDINIKDSLIKENYIKVVPKLVPEFETDIVEGYYPLKVKFNDRSSGNAKTWLWDFGDGTKSNQQNPVHLFENPGKYTVTLEITDSIFRKSLSKYQIIKANRYPINNIEIKTENEIVDNLSAIGKSGFVLDSNIIVNTWNYRKADYGYGEYELVLSSTSLIGYDNSGNKKAKFDYSNANWFPNYIRKADENTFYQYGVYGGKFYVNTFDADYKLLDSKIYYSNNANGCSDLCPLNDNSFVLIGSNNDKYNFLQKVNKNGTVQWTNTFRSTSQDVWQADRARIICNDDTSFSIFIKEHVSHKARIMKYLYNCNLIFNKEVFDHAMYRVGNFIRSSNGDYYLIGSIYDKDFGYIKRLSSNADSINQFNLKSKVQFFDIAQYNDSVFVACGSFDGQAGFALFDSNFNFKEYVFNDRPGKLSSVFVDDNKGLLFVGDLKINEFKYNAYYLLTNTKFDLNFSNSPDIENIQKYDIYPNPNSGQGLFKFELSTPSSANLSIYSIIGDEVESRDFGYLSAGFHEIPFDFSILPVGNYLAVFRKGSFVTTKQFVIIR